MGGDQRDHVLGEEQLNIGEGTKCKTCFRSPRMIIVGCLKVFSLFWEGVQLNTLLKLLPDLIMGCRQLGVRGL